MTDVVLIIERETVQACRELLTTMIVRGRLQRYGVRAASSGMRRGYRRPSTPLSCSCAPIAGRPTSTPCSIRVGDQARVAERETMHFELSIINGKAVFDIIAPVGGMHRDRSGCVSRARHGSPSTGQLLPAVPEQARLPDHRPSGLPRKRLRRGRAEVDRQLSWQHPARFSRASAVLVTQ